MLRFVIGLTLVVAASGCATPESVVRAAVEAAETGDLHAYESCFTPRSRPVIRTLRRASGPLVMGQDASQIRVEARPGATTSWNRRVVSVTDGSRIVDLVLRGDAGAWRIDLIDTERRAASSGGRIQ